MSQADAPQTSVTQPAEPKQGSPIRLIVLLGILAIVLGAFLVDLFYMFDAVNAATLRLQAAADKAAQRPRKDGNSQFLSREEVAAAIGFQPTNSKVDDNGQLIEQYRWWGALPLERRYIQAVYADADGQQYERYTISNRDIFGNDVDPEAVNLNSDSPPSDPANTEPSPSTSEGDRQALPGKEAAAPPPGETSPSTDDAAPPPESDSQDQPADKDPNET